MNSYEIADNFHRHGHREDALGRAVRFLNEFHHEVDSHSDGWAYWPVPVKAADRLITLIESGQATEAELKKALTPIKAFYTRRGYAAGMKWPEVY